MTQANTYRNVNTNKDFTQTVDCDISKCLSQNLSEICAFLLEFDVFQLYSRKKKKKGGKKV